MARWNTLVTSYNNFKSWCWGRILSGIRWAVGTLIIYDISSTSSPICQMIICIVKLDSLDYAIGLCNWIMQFKSFHWHSHHGLWAMTPCSTNMIVLCNITLVLSELSWEDLFIFWGVFYKTITTHMLVGYEMTMANSALWGLLAIYHLISNVH